MAQPKKTLLQYCELRSLKLPESSHVWSKLWTHCRQKYRSIHPNVCIQYYSTLYAPCSGRGYRFHSDQLYNCKCTLNSNEGSSMHGMLSEGLCCARAYCIGIAPPSLGCPQRHALIHIRLSLFLTAHRLDVGTLQMSNCQYLTVQSTGSPATHSTTETYLGRQTSL